MAAWPIPISGIRALGAERVVIARAPVPALQQASVALDARSAPCGAAACLNPPRRSPATVVRLGALPAFRVCAR